jgi:hypothetical protein
MGIALVAIVGCVFFKQPLTAVQVMFIALIFGGAVGEPVDSNARPDTWMEQGCPPLETRRFALRNCEISVPFQNFLQCILDDLHSLLLVFYGCGKLLLQEQSLEAF